MKKTIYFSSITLIIVSAFLVTCKKEKDLGNQEQSVSFAIDYSNFQKSLMLKNALSYNLSDAKKIILTIQTVAGSVTDYTSTEVNIYQMNGAFFSQKLMLKTGSYRLTEFLLVDATDNIIFAAPLTGSPEAQNVTQPLPVTFDVVKNASTPVSVEVIGTENKTPGDLGLVSFSISEGLDFMIGVADLKSNRLLSAKLSVFSGSYLHVQLLDSIANNKVIVKDSMGSRAYTLKIEKEGYVSYTHLLTKDSLKLFSNVGNHLPLLVEMEKNSDVGTVTDIDGNVYHTVTIGSQVWMVENLKTTKYRNGDLIPNVTDSIQWGNLTTGAYCNYHNIPSFSDSYGRLYNWYAVGDSRNIAPNGWHVSTDGEWALMLSYLGGRSNDALKLMESDTAHWYSPNTGATNETGFTAMPGGRRDGDYGCPFVGLGWLGSWWTSTKIELGNPYYSSRVNYWSWYIYHSFVHYENQIGNHGLMPNYGFSVRCIRD